MEKDTCAPEAVFTPAFGGARIAEIKSIMKQLEDCDHGRRVFQTLPRHMQRRQVSSNPKRLPHYLREKHKREQGRNIAKVTRRPSRKHRRRPRNLLEEYNRRQKDHIWLETHVWHAKRFHMIKRWGYTVPDTSTFKGYRASYRAAKTTCLAQDISYLCCIELEGKQSTLLSGLSRITQPSGLASLTQPEVQQGELWELVTFFKPDRQPYGALGDVDILWLPSSPCSPETPSTKAKLWIWVHPSAHNHVIETLVEIYDLVKTKGSAEMTPNQKQKDIVIKEVENRVDDIQAQKDIVIKRVDNQVDEIHASSDKLGSVSVLDVKANNESSKAFQDLTVKANKQKGSKKRKGENEDSGRSKKRSKNVNETKLAPRNIPFERTPKYSSNSTCVSMTLLKDTLNRYRLTGPKSLNVLRAAFCPANVSGIKSEDVNNLAGDENANEPWWEDYYCDEEKQRCHQNQKKVWKELSVSHMGKRVVFPLTVRDPRATLPDKKAPIDTAKNTNKKDSSQRWPVDSPLFVSELRDKISLSKEPDATVNSRRSQLLVPASRLPECPEESKLPLLMLSRPCTQALGYGMGWDVIVCPGWGMSVWMSFVLNGGVASGEQAAEDLYMEFLTPQTANFFPDTPAGDYYSSLLAQERRIEFFKRPPTCRDNFIKLGVQYPFSSPWQKLVQDWVLGTQDVFVLRDPTLLNYLASQFGDAFDIMKRSNMNNEQKVDTTLEGGPVQSLNVLVTEDTATSRQECKIEKTDGTLSKDDDAYKELQLSKYGCLVKVKLIVEKRDTLKSCGMICLPQKEDIEEKYRQREHNATSGSIMEPEHIDKQHEQRKQLKVEHGRNKRKICLLKSKAKLKVEKQMDMTDVAERGETFKKLTEKALESVQENNKVLFAKHTSYNSDMENLWLMRRDEPLQCCSRKIMGYVTHGNFSMTLGRGAGIGWVALKPLLDYLQLYKELQGKHPDNGPDSGKNKSAKAVNLKSVLVRNPSSLQYNWATLSIVR